MRRRILEEAILAICSSIYSGKCQKHPAWRWDSTTLEVNTGGQQSLSNAYWFARNLKKYNSTTSALEFCRNWSSSDFQQWAISTNLEDEIKHGLAIIFSWCLTVSYVVNYRFLWRENFHGVLSPTTQAGRERNINELCGGDTEKWFFDIFSLLIDMAHKRICQKNHQKRWEGSQIIHRFLFTILSLFFSPFNIFEVLS